MRRLIFLVHLFYFFLRLQIYEAIAAIFCQSASYVNWNLAKQFYGKRVKNPKVMD